MKKMVTRTYQAVIRSDDCNLIKIADAICIATQCCEKILDSLLTILASPDRNDIHHSARNKMIKSPPLVAFSHWFTVESGDADNKISPYEVKKRFLAYWGDLEEQDRAIMDCVFNSTAAIREDASWVDRRKSWLNLLKKLNNQQGYVELANTISLAPDLPAKEMTEDANDSNITVYAKNLVSQLIGIGEKADHEIKIQTYKKLLIDYENFKKNCGEKITNKDFSNLIEVDKSKTKEQQLKELYETLGNKGSPQLVCSLFKKTQGWEKNIDDLIKDAKNKIEVSENHIKRQKLLKGINVNSIFNLQNIEITTTNQKGTINLVANKPAAYSYVGMAAERINTIVNKFFKQILERQNAKKEIDAVVIPPWLKINVRKYKKEFDVDYLQRRQFKGVDKLSKHFCETQKINESIQKARIYGIDANLFEYVLQRAKTDNLLQNLQDLKNHEINLEKYETTKHPTIKHFSVDETKNAKPSPAWPRFSGITKKDKYGQDVWGDNNCPCGYVESDKGLLTAYLRLYKFVNNTFTLSKKFTEITIYSKRLNNEIFSENGIKQASRNNGLHRLRFQEENLVTKKINKMALLLINKPYDKNEKRKYRKIESSYIGKNFKSKNKKLENLVGSFDLRVNLGIEESEKNISKKLLAVDLGINNPAALSILDCTADRKNCLIKKFFLNDKECIPYVPEGSIDQLFNKDRDSDEEDAFFIKRIHTETKNDQILLIPTKIQELNWRIAHLAHAAMIQARTDNELNKAIEIANKVYDRLLQNRQYEKGYPNNNNKSHGQAFYDKNKNQMAKKQGVGGVGIKRIETYHTLAKTYQSYISKLNKEGVAAPEYITQRLKVIVNKKTNLQKQRADLTVNLIIRIAIAEEVSIIVIENLKSFKTSVEYSRFTNKNLTIWRHRYITKRLKMAAQEHGIRVKEAPAKYTSQTFWQTGKQILRCNHVSPNEVKENLKRDSHKKIMDYKGDSKYMNKLKAFWLSCDENVNKMPKTPDGLCVMPAPAGQFVYSINEETGGIAENMNIHSDLNASINIGIRGMPREKKQKNQTNEND